MPLKEVQGRRQRGAWQSLTSIVLLWSAKNVLTGGSGHVGSGNAAATMQEAFGTHRGASSGGIGVVTGQQWRAGTGRVLGVSARSGHQFHCHLEERNRISNWNQHGITTDYMECTHPCGISCCLRSFLASWCWNGHSVSWSWNRQVWGARMSTVLCGTVTGGAALSGQTVPAGTNSEVRKWHWDRDRHWDKSSYW